MVLAVLRLVVLFQSANMKKSEFVLGMLMGMAISVLASMFILHNPIFQEISFVVLCSVAAAIVTIFIDYLIAPKQIFGFWQNVLKKISESPYKTLAKPLGTCIYCMNVYVLFACYLLLWFKMDISWWYFIPAAGLSHISLALIDKNINS